MLTFDEAVLFSTKKITGHLLQIVKLDFINPFNDKIIQLNNTNLQ